MSELTGTIAIAVQDWYEFLKERADLSASGGGEPQEHSGRYFVLWRLERCDVLLF